MNRAGWSAALAASVACGSGGPAPPGAPPLLPTPAAGACAPVDGTPALTTTVVASGLTEPVDVQSAPGDPDRLFVVEQAGRIRVVRDGVVRDAPFLELGDRVLTGGERGLLGLAFHPGYSRNGRLFVNYTDRGGSTRIAEFRASGDPDRADPGSERLILAVDQPFSNHNGGGLAFGNDGFLYVALGDGGSGGDPQRNGQSLGTLLGKILRLDVDAAAPYAVPGSNPFVARPGAQPEIWAYGLRNPWRFAVDRATGDLVIGDVGQGAVEEIDVGRAVDGGGENFGWNVMEGSRCFRPPTDCPTEGLTLPVAEYTHADGCSVTGGVVYRGCRMPGYHGTYFYGDFCSGFVRSFRLVDAQVTDPRDWTASLGPVSGLASFGTDADGEVLMVSRSTGRITRIVPAS